MPKKIRAERVASALNNMANWRGKAKSQGATHLMPMLALIERGAGDPPGKATLMNETPHEFEFWDKYFRLEDGNEAKPYFNPVTLRRAEAGFPHSNSATIRKNTFAGKWNAATRRTTDDGEEWELAEDYADIFRDKVLTKGADVARAPTLDIAMLFFRDAGRWVNCVSARAEAEVLSMAKRQEDLERGVEAMLALSDPEAEVSFQVTRGLTRPVWEPDAGTERLLAIAEGFHKAVGMKFRHASFGGGSDGNFTGAMGVPTLDGLGVEGNRVHTLEEHIRVASLAERGRVMAGLLATID